MGGINWANIGTGAINNLVGTGMGLLLEKHNDERQKRQQEALLNQQYVIDNRMAEENYKRQMRMWQETNYTAQMDQLAKAGLNPALMYKQGGPGGTTTAATGAVHSASAPAGGMEIMNMMMQRAQIELMKAQTEKTKAEATKTAGVDTELAGTQIKDLLQGIENQKAQQELTDVQTKIATIQEFVLGKTQNLQVSYMMKIVAQAQETLDMLENNKQISEATVNEKIELVTLEVINSYLTALKTQQDTAKSKAEITNMQEQIKLGQGKLALDTAIADGTILNWKGGALNVIQRLVGSWLGKGKGGN